MIPKIAFTLFFVTVLLILPTVLWLTGSEPPKARLVKQLRRVLLVLATIQFIVGVTTILLPSDAEDKLAGAFLATATFATLGVAILAKQLHKALEVPSVSSEQQQ